jgi:SAM-dependent methyltransferase
MLPFDDSRFDQIVSNLGVNNFADPARAMRESRRVAKRDAEIAIATNVEGTMAELYSAYREALARIMRDAGERIERLVSARTSSAKLAALLDASGFDVARTSQGTFTMRFCDSGALFRHSFIRVGFLDAWRDAVDEASREEALTALGARLDEIAKERDGLTLTIPIVCMVGRAA